MKSRNTYSLVASLLLTAIACARQEEPDYDYGDEDDEMMDEGGTSTGTGGKSTLPVGKSGSTSAGTGGSGTKLPPAGSGGKGGTKSTGGTGGSSMGGSSGSGGGGSGGTGGGEEPVNDPVDGLSVTFKAEGSSGDVDFVGGETHVLNESAETFSLANIKIRYYFTNELNSPPGFVWNWGQFGLVANLGNITCTGQALEMPSPKPGANFYIEITCPDGTFASGNLLKFYWKAGNQGNGKLTQDGDWSYVADGEAPKIVVMDGNTIIWGVEP